MGDTNYLLLMYGACTVFYLYSMTRAWRAARRDPKVTPQEQRWWARAMLYAPLWPLFLLWLVATAVGQWVGTTVGGLVSGVGRWIGEFTVDVSREA